MHQIHIFVHEHILHFHPRIICRVLGCGARKGSACTLGTSLGPGQGPWHVLSASKGTKSREKPRYPFSTSQRLAGAMQTLRRFFHPHEF